MSPEILLYLGSGIVIVWGLAHIAPTRSVVRGFGELSEDNRRIITMEWVAEGLALAFLGVLVLLVTLQAGPREALAVLVIRACAVMLLIMAVWTFSIGGKTSVFPIKICPLVLSTAAVLCLLGTVL
jgi:hypothetical protein